MRNSSRFADGLTLVEVVIAVAILAVGVLAAFAMQASALQATRTATITQDLSNIAASEIELQRAFVRTVASPATLPCRTAFEQPMYACSVTVLPCTYISGTLTCVNQNVVGPSARQITVTVTGPQNRTAVLSTITR